jgi:proline dehydrogenase
MEESPHAAVLTARFIAGREIEDALRVTARLNQAGLRTTLDYLGESVTTLDEAESARNVYLKLLEEIHARKLQSNVSLKLTQLGLNLSEAACRENVAAVARRARELDNFVRVDMESSSYTERTLAVVHDLHEAYGTVGAVIQAYLYRSGQDVEELIRRGIRVRLCKGAYDEPPTVAFPRSSQVDTAFRKLAESLLLHGNYAALATHDERLLTGLLRWAEAHHVPREGYEIQMLYGIRRDLQARFARQGHRVRVYVPFGRAWYPYLMRRLAERPANLYFALRNLFRR